MVPCSVGLVCVREWGVVMLAASILQDGSRCCLPLCMALRFQRSCSGAQRWGREAAIYPFSPPHQQAQGPWEMLGSTGGNGQSWQGEGLLPYGLVWGRCVSPWGTSRAYPQAPGRVEQTPLRSSSLGWPELPHTSHPPSIPPRCSSATPAFWGRPIPLPGTLGPSWNSELPQLPMCLWQV